MSDIKKVVTSVLQQHPERVEKYGAASHKEKLQVMGFLTGMVFKKLRGRGKRYEIQQAIKYYLD